MMGDMQFKFKAPDKDSIRNGQIYKVVFRNGGYTMELERPGYGYWIASKVNDTDVFDISLIIPGSDLRRVFALAELKGHPCDKIVRDVIKAGLEMAFSNTEELGRAFAVKVESQESGRDRQAELQRYKWMEKGRALENGQ